MSDSTGQANLSALDAMIEAARAGKDFAVVAAEAKLLADRMTKAAEAMVVQRGAIRKAPDLSLPVADQVRSAI